MHGAGWTRGTWALGLVALLVLAACQPAGGNTGAAPKQAPAAPKDQAAARAPAGQAADSAPIRLGVITERTGPIAMHGEAGARGVEFFLEELNAQGGLLGRRVEAIYRDSKATQDEAVRQARDLLLNEKVDFLIHNINSAECLAVSEVAKEARKIVFTSCGIDDVVTSKGHRYVFRLPNIGSRTQGQSAAKYMADRLRNVKTIAVIANDYSFGRSVVEAFKGKANELMPNLEWVGETWPKFGETDYSPYITTLQNQKADATFYFMAAALPFFNQAAPVNLHKQTILLSTYWGGVDDIATLKEDTLPDGAILGGYPWYVIDTPANKSFVERYRSRLNLPPRGAAYFQNMTMQFLTEAIRRANTIETEKVIDTLEGMELETLVGKTRIRPFDHQGASPHWVGTARWDPNMKMGVITDIVVLESEQFLPTEAEIRQMRGQ